MTGLEKIITSPETIKSVSDKAEGLLKSLFGKAFEEKGEMIADQIRLRRFKNQVNILAKAESFLREKNIDPKKINLKLLVPLIEYSSLEEDENMQTTWANVIANIASYETEQLFNLKCIEVLKEITPNEILLLDNLFAYYLRTEEETLERWQSSSYLKDRTSVGPEYAVVSSLTFAKQLNIEEKFINLYIDRLISFGVIKYEQPELSESTNDVSVSEAGVLGLSIEVKSYELETSERVHFTNFGIYFVKLCKFEPS
jgi:Abortive infection alpha